MLHARPDYNRIQDPIDHIPENEPVFLIRAQDVACVPTMEAWIKAAEVAGTSEDMLQLVEKHISLVEAWQAEHGKKTPDLPV